VIGPQHLRSLDAIHLATTLKLWESGHIDTILTYNVRLVEAAALHGIPTLSPSPAECEGGALADGLS